MTDTPEPHTHPLVSDTREPEPQETRQERVGVLVTDDDPGIYVPLDSACFQCAYCGITATHMDPPCKKRNGEPCAPSWEPLPPYPVLLTRDADGDVIATTPTLDGCITHGATVTEALRNAAQAQGDWLEAATANGSWPREPRAALIADAFQKIGHLRDSPDANITGAIHGVITGYTCMKEELTSIDTPMCLLNPRKAVNSETFRLGEACPCANCVDAREPREPHAALIALARQGSPAEAAERDWDVCQDCGHIRALHESCPAFVDEPQRDETAQQEVISRAMAALESDATPEQREAAWDGLRDMFYPVTTKPREQCTLEDTCRCERKGS